MKKKLDNINLLDLIPNRVVQWQIDTDDKCVLMKPKFSNRFLIKFIVPLMKRPTYRVTLDEFGSTVWNYCDGKRTVGDIAECLINDFGEAIEPVHERLGMFIRTLKVNRFIEYRS